MKMTRVKINQGDRHYKKGFDSERYSNCLISFQQGVKARDLEGVEVKTPSSGRELFVPTFNLLGVIPYNPVLQRRFLSSPGEQRLEALPVVRYSFSDRYFGGKSLALVPGEVEMSGRGVSIYPGVQDRDCEWGFKTSGGKVIPATLVVYDSLLEGFFTEEEVGRKIRLENSTVISEENGLSIANSLRGFLKGPMMAYVRGATGALENCGQFVFRQGAWGRYQKIIGELEKRFGIKVPRNPNNFAFE